MIELCTFQGDNDSQPTGLATWSYGYAFDWAFYWTETGRWGGRIDKKDEQHVTVRYNLKKRSSKFEPGSLTDRTLKMALNITADGWERPEVTMKSTTWWSKIFGSEEKDGRLLEPLADLRYLFMAVCQVNPTQQLNWPSLSPRNNVPAR